MGIIERLVDILLYTDILEQWWNGYKNQVKENTQYKKEMEMKTHIIPFFERKLVNEITTKDIQNFINDKLQQGLASSTVLMLYRVINPSLRWAVGEGYIDINPCNGVVLPKEQHKEIQVFKSNEIQKLIRVARPKWLGDMILLSYRTGMRRGEVFGLKWDDIDFDNKFLMVRRTISAYAPKVKLIHAPKTKKSVRRIMLDDESIGMLKRRNKGSKSEWVFENQYGELMSPWYTTKYMIEACKKAGIPHRSFHTLRHTHATVLLSANINPKIVQERLGHSKISMTLDTYSHVLPTMQGLAVDVFNDIK